MKIEVLFEVDSIQALRKIIQVGAEYSLESYKVIRWKIVKKIEKGEDYE